MDSTVVEEIANQLGIAVDQVSQFIGEYLPEYGSLKAMQLTVPVVTIWSVFLLAILVAVVSIVIASYSRKKRIRKFKERNQPRPLDGDPYDWENYSASYVCLLFIILAALILVFAIPLTAINVPQIIGWNEYPNSMLIDTVLDSVQ